MHGATRLSFADTATARPVLPFAPETPIAFEYNGIGYAVMMASAENLVDFAVGFTLAEGLVTDAAAIGDITPAPIEGGWIVRITLPDAAAATLRERVRLRLVEGSCGLCGIDSIAQAVRPLSPIATRPHIDAAATRRALGELAAHQPRGRATGGMHAAAFCDADGAIVATREDVGRHNALDKLIGHAARERIDLARGFILLSARCSFELVEKTVRARCPALVTISAPTTLAAERACAARLTLLTLARADSAVIVSDPHGVFAKGPPD